MSRWVCMLRSGFAGSLSAPLPLRSVGATARPLARASCVPRPRDPRPPHPPAFPALHFTINQLRFRTMASDERRDGSSNPLVTVGWDWGSGCGFGGAGESGAAHEGGM